MWRCCGRWRRTRPRKGKARERHDSSSDRCRDPGPGRRQRPQHGAQPSSWEVPAASGTMDSWYRGRSNPRTSTQGLCLPILSRVPVARAVGRGETCKTVWYGHQAITEIGSCARQRARGSASVSAGHCRQGLTDTQSVALRPRELGRNAGPRAHLKPANQNLCFNKPPGALSARSALSSSSPSGLAASLPGRPPPQQRPPVSSRSLGVAPDAPCPSPQPTARQAGCFRPRTCLGSPPPPPCWGARPHLSHLLRAAHNPTAPVCKST